MKKAGTSIVSHFIYIFVLCLSAFPTTGVSPDSKDIKESTLEIQPTILLSHNSSDNGYAEVNIKPSESNPVTSSEASVSADPAPTDVLGQIPEAAFSEVASEHLGVANEIINNDTPIVISRIDSATEELQKRANIASPLSNQEVLVENVASTQTNITEPEQEVEEVRSEVNLTPDSPKNETDKNAEDIPSFSEWAQKHLEEAEKKQQVNSSLLHPTANTTKQGSGAKLRWKNYASVDCGAKVILANAEAQHTWAILMGTSDDYTLNPCNSRIWFIVELCEAIQLKKIDLANYELFSSSPKDFTVSVSDRFPTRDWAVVGQFTANDQRDVQSFDVDAETFGKYVKVEIKSHYGAEHYCPLSLFRAYGMSVFEVLQKDDPAHQQHIEEDDDDDSLDNISREDKSGNILSSAADAVLSVVKKAAQVLGNKVNKTNESSQMNETKPQSPIIKSCSSPSHYVVCNNCSDMLFGKIFELLSCRPRQIRNLVSVPFISKALANSMICHGFGFDLKDKSLGYSLQSGSASVGSFFPSHFLGAMCNALAITYNKVAYNMSHHYTNTTEPLSSEKLVDVDEPKVMPEIEPRPQNREDQSVNNQATEPLNVDRPDIISKSSCSTDTTYTSQIKPSKSLATELPIHSELNTELSNDAGQPSQGLENAEEQHLPDTPAAAEAAAAINEGPSEQDLQNDNNGEENVDKLITELSTEASSSVVNAPAAANLQGQKESVFLRLSNRIKALERNMSLSSQYLEELSKRYKKQVEEMQRTLEKAEQTLNDVTAKHEERHKQLEDRLKALTDALENIAAERNAYANIFYCLFFVVASMFLFLCINKYTASKPSEAPVAKIQRRNSVDVVTRMPPKKKKRRPSDQALKIVASAASGEQLARQKRKKKKSSNPLEGENFFPSCPATKPNADWVEGRGRIIEDIPFALEEADSLTLESLPLAPELSTISAPAYAKTAATARLGRTMSLQNGKLANSVEVRKRQSSPTSSTSGSSSTPKKDKMGFRKFFKKVF